MRQSREYGGLGLTQGERRSVRSRSGHVQGAFNETDAKPSSLICVSLQCTAWQDPLEKERLPTPAFWSGEFHGLFSPWDGKESDTTE